MRILNLYAGIGGNRKLWGDAHEYLLKYYKEFDFIWSSPPCPSHGVSRFWGSKANYKKMKYPSPIYPDMELYQEIIFLKHFFKGKWVVENVIGYYDPLIKPYQYRSHYYWANFHIDGEKRDRRFITESRIDILEKKAGLSLKGIKFKSVRKLQVIRNCVEPEAGLHIFNMAFKEQQVTL